VGGSQPAHTDYPVGVRLLRRYGRAMPSPPRADPLPPYATTKQLAAARDAVLAGIVDRLSADVRVEGAWLSGSFGRGEEDAWSDLDLHVAVSDDSLDAFLVERPSLYEAVGDPVLVQYEMPSDSLTNGVFQLVWYAGGVEVDWNIGPASQACKPPWHRPLFERRPFMVCTLPELTAAERSTEAAEQLTFFWAMAPVAIKQAARRRSANAAGMIAMLTQALIRMWRLVNQPEGPAPWRPSLTNRPLDDELRAELPTLGETITPELASDVIEQLCDEVRRLQPALAEIGAEVDPQIPVESERMLHLLRRTLQFHTP
jgi:predicted nucleotidyltransferase